ncbi:MAG: hypothetical protein CSA44_01630 [Gammaproteobacteria bacterium]|nr:MAG: hypothetical protein CSA44_01630 [Gammaproteobacteria bacterium]
MFATTLKVNIEHINYGGHLAHDKLVTLMHEARLRFFDRLGQSEIDFYGISLILKSITVNYRQEANAALPVYRIYAARHWRICRRNYPLICLNNPIDYPVLS